MTFFSKLSEISGIPLEDIEFAKVKPQNVCVPVLVCRSCASRCDSCSHPFSPQGRGTFPCDISFLDIPQDLDWNPKVSTLKDRTLNISDDGAVIFYR